MNESVADKVNQKDIRMGCPVLKIMVDLNDSIGRHSITGLFQQMFCISS